MGAGKVDGLAAFLDTAFLVPHKSLVQGWMLIRNRDRFGAPVLGQLCVLGNESSLGDPVLGGPVTALGFNFGNIRYRETTEEWAKLASGHLAGVNDGEWFAFPDADTGMLAWGMFLAAHGYVPALEAHDWRAFTERYFGSGVHTAAEVDQYVADLEEKAARYAARLEKGGF